MPVADHGGWDLAVEIAADTVARALGPGFPGPLQPTPIATPNLRGTVMSQGSVDGASFAASRDLSVTVTIAGLLVVTMSASAPEELLFRPVPFHAYVRVTDRLELRANAAVVDFAPMPALQQPQLVAVVNPSLLNAPAVRYAIAWAAMTGRGLQEASLIIQAVTTAARDAVAAAVRRLGVVTLIPAPTLPITSSDLRGRTRSAHALYGLGGPPGNQNLISRSMLLLDSTTLAPIDAAAVSLSNESLLHDFVRPALIRALGLPPGRFVAGHPCLFTGPWPISLPGGSIPLISSVTLDSLIAGIDESGLLHVAARLTANGEAGLFAIRSTVDSSFVISATSAGGTLTVAIAPSGRPAVSTDLELPVWGHVFSFFTGGSVSVSITAAADAFAGHLLDDTIARAIAGVLPGLSVPVALPGRTPPLVVRTTRTTQPDAPRRTLPVTPPTSDPYRSHDLIVNAV